MAYKYYEIKIGDIYLTETGAAANAENLLCKLQVQGVNRLRSNFKRIRLPDAIDGTPIFQTIEVGSKSKELIISIGILKTSVLDQLFLMLEDINQNSGTINIIGTGATGNFNVNCLPDVIPIEFGEFRGDRVKNVTLKFVTA